MCRSDGLHEVATEGERLTSRIPRRGEVMLTATDTAPSNPLASRSTVEKVMVTRTTETVILAAI